jgi:hypothetical protein
VRETVELFLKKLEQKKHINELINHVKLVLTIGSDRDSCSILIHNGTVSMSPSNLSLSPLRVKIQGNTEAISSLLDGSLKLRVGAARKELYVDGSFRHKLLLESLFYLGGKSL